MKEKESLRRSELVIVSAAVGAALLSCLPRLSSGFTYDELYTVYYFIRERSFWEAISTYRVFNNHLGFSALAYLSQAVLGLSEWSVRLPALVLGLGVIPMTWLLGRGLISRRVGLLGAGLVALCPVYLSLDVSARGYTGMILLTVCSTLLFFSLLESARPTTLLLYPAVTSLAVYFHLYAIWVVFVQGLMVGELGIKRDPRARALGMAWLVGCLLCVVLYAPVLEQFFRSVSGRGQGAHSPLFVFDLLHYLGGGVHPVDSTLVFLLAALGWWRLWQTERRLAAYMALVLAAPLAAALLVRPFDLYPRFFIFVGPYYMLCAAVAIASLAGRIRSWPRSAKRSTVVTLGIVIMSLGAVRWVTASSVLGKGPVRYREPMVALEAGAGPETRMVVVGRNAELMAVYAARPFATPETLAELEAVQASGGPVHCAYLEHSWNREGERRIRDHLSRHARSRAMHGVTLYFLDE